MSEPTKPTNTTAEDPLLRFAGMMGDTDGFIYAQEAQGQRELIESESLPSDFNRTDEQEFLDLGFTFGEPFEDDPLFRPATLPEGWKREPADHDMWSYVIDERGIRRVAVFYKAAFYDRRAFMDLISPGRDIAMQTFYRKPEDTHIGVERFWDVMTEPEREDFRAAVMEKVKDIEEHPSIYGDLEPMVSDLRERYCQ